MNPTHERIVAALHENGGYMSAAQVMAATGLSNSATYRALTDMQCLEIRMPYGKRKNLVTVYGLPFSMRPDSCAQYDLGGYRVDRQRGTDHAREALNKARAHVGDPFGQLAWGVAA